MSHKKFQTLTEIISRIAMLKLSGFNYCFTEMCVNIYLSLRISLDDTELEGLIKTFVV